MVLMQSSNHHRNVIAFSATASCFAWFTKAFLVKFSFVCLFTGSDLKSNYSHSCSSPTATLKVERFRERKSTGSSTAEVVCCSWREHILDCTTEPSTACVSMYLPIISPGQCTADPGMSFAPETWLQCQREMA